MSAHTRHPGTGRVHLLTSSRLATWQRCPRAHHYRYEAGNRSPIPDPEIEALIVQASKDAGIERHFLAGTHAQEVARIHGIKWHVLVTLRRDAAGGFRREAEQERHGALGDRERRDGQARALVRGHHR